MAKCKRCGLKTVLSEDDIQKMVEQVTSMKSVRLVSSDVYENRFDICQNCDDFMYGSACGVCGCVMQVRARLSDAKCPKKKW
jgi:hypothetical protein